MARALEVREIPAPRDKVQADVEGDIEAVDKVLRITRIRVRYRLNIPAGTRERAERAVATHATMCPAANSVRGCIDLDISADITEE
ncbi:MAG: OsmC family protein [Vicinamibacterales bacterium]|nr:OsmC family protein [Vicinamibacterales bacterium]MDP7477886.1 OsmC family protein [Vicinamibacterales bacterium]MDP7690672.1 OsmC family protein [Vicinamibacterales bacterium]